MYWYVEPTFSHVSNLTHGILWAFESKTLMTLTQMELRGGPKAIRKCYLICSLFSRMLCFNFLLPT